MPALLLFCTSSFSLLLCFNVFFSLDGLKTVLCFGGIILQQKWRTEETCFTFQNKGEEWCKLKGCAVVCFGGSHMESPKVAKSFGRTPRNLEGILQAAQWVVRQLCKWMSLQRGRASNAKWESYCRKGFELHLWAWWDGIAKKVRWCCVILQLTCVQFFSEGNFHQTHHISPDLRLPVNLEQFVINSLYVNNTM